MTLGFCVIVEHRKRLLLRPKQGFIYLVSYRQAASRHLDWSPVKLSDKRVANIIQTWGPFVPYERDYHRSLVVAYGRLGEIRNVPLLRLFQELKEGKKGRGKV